MKLFAHLALLLTGILLLAHYLPAGYWLVADKQQRAPYVFYSCVSKHFLFTRYAGREMTRTDAEGKVYEREDFEDLLPLDNYMQLYKDRRMPKEIDGVAVTPEKLRHDRINLRIKPAQLDSPAVALYPLIESDSGRVHLEMPGDFLRFGPGLEFIDVKSNAVIREKSDRFMAAFAAAKFVFPVKLLGGNPSTLKPYDEGYFLVDAQNAIFQLRQIHGEPDLKRLVDLAAPETRPLWAGLKPRYLGVQEQDNHEVHVVIVEDSGRTHLVVGPDYQLVTLPLQTYNPATMTLSIRGDMLNRLITVNAENEVEAVVLTRDYQLVDRYTETLPERKDRTAGKIASVIFPFTLDFEDDASGFIGFYFSPGRPIAFALNAALLLPVLGWLLIRKHPLTAHLPGLVAMALTGLFGLIMFFLIPRISPFD
jgi:hypothetical protein